nr:hypothetical protein [Tanacetum cinerariifolium]
MFNDVKLQVDYECEMEFELLRLVKKQLKEGYVLNEVLEASSTKLVEESSKKAEAEITQEDSLNRAGNELEQERSKKQKVEDDKEFEELKKCLKIIPDDGDD